MWLERLGAAGMHRFHMRGLLAHRTKATRASKEMRKRLFTGNRCSQKTSYFVKCLSDLRKSYGW
ncbi:hypothetical protein EV131_11471 [Rhizobium laguerreae]|uniref:Uncharacterized protein n=1 Tax=Rhizobium laguerreae TaxID=1076926 RepID=A0AAX2QEE8_9HYPH|nr:hypothetical protein EV131_11471 [Rhizobium laguerreae]